MKKSTCSSCGYQWPTGTDGRHSCIEVLREWVKEYRNELRGVLVTDGGTPELRATIIQRLERLNTFIGE